MTSVFVREEGCTLEGELGEVGPIVPISYIAVKPSVFELLSEVNWIVSSLPVLSRSEGILDPEYRPSCESVVDPPS